MTKTIHLPRWDKGAHEREEIPSIAKNLPETGILKKIEIIPLSNPPVVAF